MWQAWLNAILGLWFIVAAFIIAASKTANMTSNLIAGIIVVILGVWASVRYKGWKNWVVALIGVWMIISGFWFPGNYVATVGNDIVAGTVIIILSTWAVFSRVPQPKEA
jgi:F0F1-type ATP synthase membrane subunit a